MISFTGVGKRFGDNPVLIDVDLMIADGEVVAVIGPSGSGKSTLLRCINRLETIDQGSIVVDGVRVEDPYADIARLRREVGMVFQGFHLYPHLSVLDNITLAPITVRGQRRAEAEKTAHALLARVGIPEKAAAVPAQLSGGQQQRVAIARALAMEPKILLFDEPTSALDPRMAAEVEAVIADLAASGQKTMLLVTHSLPLARRSAHTVHVADGGQIVESGPPAAVFEAPREPTTRRFLAEVTRG